MRQSPASPPLVIQLPTSILVQDDTSAAVAAEKLGSCVVKAQAPTGKRGKAGGIKLADTPEEADAHLVSKGPMVMFSTEGEMDIEEVVAKTPEKLRRKRLIHVTVLGIAKNQI